MFEDPAPRPNNVAKALKLPRIVAYSGAARAAAVHHHIESAEDACLWVESDHTPGKPNVVYKLSSSPISVNILNCFKPIAQSIPLM